MARIENYEVISNMPLTKDVYKMVLKGDGSWVDKPGKFINITIENKYLKRPISICDYTNDSLTIIYKVVGDGTKILASKIPTDIIEALIDLGNGFDTNKTDNEVLVVGGGVGVPPMYGVVKQLLKEDKKVTVILGFQSSDDVFYYDEFKDLGVTVHVSTNDGTFGTKGFVSDVINSERLNSLYYLTCGPQPMLKAVYDCSNNKGQLSFEERMGCGFGACMGCSCKTIAGYKRICVEGPIMDSGEILWKD